MNILIKLLVVVSILLICACSDEEPNKFEAHTNAKLAERADIMKLAERAENIKINDDINNYVVGLVASTKNNIFDPTIIEDNRLGYYLIKFQTSDSNLMLKDVDKDPKAYDINNAMNSAWEAQFCTPQLKSIIKNHSSIIRIKGVIFDTKLKSMQAIAICDGSNATTIEIMDKGIQNNLNTLQDMSGKMEQWK